MDFVLIINQSSFLSVQEIIPFALNALTASDSDNNYNTTHIKT